MIRVVQSFDDGVVDDIRLTRLLRRYGAHADFNLVPGLYQQRRRAWGWKHQDKDVWRLALDELPEVYQGFDIAAHSMTHPDLTQVDADTLYHEVQESKRKLEELFRSAVLGFCYPFNIYNPTVINALEKAGYRYARGSGSSGRFPPADPLQFNPDCHFLADDFWDRYHLAKTNGSRVFYFWGHSYELTSERLWENFERKLEAIGNDPTAVWTRLPDLFAWVGAGPLSFTTGSSIYQELREI